VRRLVAALVAARDLRLIDSHEANALAAATLTGRPTTAGFSRPSTTAGMRPL